MPPIDAPAPRTRAPRKEQPGEEPVVELHRRDVVKKFSQVPRIDHEHARWYEGGRS